MANSEMNKKKNIYDEKYGANKFFFDTHTDSLYNDMDQFCGGLNIFKDRYNIYTKKIK